MQRHEITELHYMCPISNLPSILTHGLLSHKLASALPGVASIADPDVQSRRSLKRVPPGRPLHDFVNLYVNGRNPMMYRQIGRMDTICVIQVSPAVLDLPGVVITDRNAAADLVRFSPSPGGLEMIEKAVTFARYWTHPGNPIAEVSHKARMCAEVLVPDRVGVKHFLGCHVFSLTGMKAVKNLCQLHVQVNRHVFFG